MTRASGPSVVGVCDVCAEPETRESPFVAVMTETRGRHAWLHADACHERYREEVATRKQAKGEVG